MKNVDFSKIVVYPQKIAMFKVSRSPKSIKNQTKIDPKMKPKNDKEKYREKKTHFGTEKPPKMSSKIKNYPILKND